MYNTIFSCYLISALFIGRFCGLNTKPYADKN